ncbi:MAG: fimbrial assembly protein [Leptothrix sp. (in: Bacteria)]|nr:fimbrial assembly protein [Leptothrix sp. (in: b-proteobacteria)]
MKTSQTGWTLVEALVSLAVTTIALGTAVPGFGEARERRHLEGAAAQLETDLQMARGQAVLQNRTVRVDFRSDSGGSCYVVHNGGPGACSCDASGAAVCTGTAEALRSMGYAADRGFTLTSNAASMAFEHVRGTVTPTSTVRITGRDRAVHVVTNIMGRVRACSPSASTWGYAAC